MSKLNPQNERIKRDYFRYLREARGKSEHTLDTARKALARFEEYTCFRDFKIFRKEQAIGFKERLAGTTSIGSGGILSRSTQATTLAVLKEFFSWLAWQPGFKSKIHVPDIEYLSLSMKDAAVAKARKLRDFPSMEQIRAVIAAMPSGTVIERRNRALIAFAILIGMRDRAIASVCLQHIDLGKSPPLVRQEPDRVATKFSKSIVTYFFPLGDDLTQIVAEWVGELRTVHLFAPSDPVFPKTKVAQGNSREFQAIGIEPCHWSDASSIRGIFRAAFTVAGLSYFPPHSFRHTLGHLMQTACRSPEEIKAWSQNLGHENVSTTLTSYGRIDPHRQGMVIGSIRLESECSESGILDKIRSLVANPADNLRRSSS